MAKIEWKYLTGDLIVTVRGRDKNERFMTFEFTCYA